jgi:BRCT domain type II-containing protein
MKFLKKFESFEAYEEEAYSREEGEKCEGCGCPKKEECDCDCGPSEMNERKKAKSKPDFLDLDKDGNKKESMKKAAKDSKSGRSSKGRGLSKAQSKLPEALRKAISKGVRD